jgi:hypothetical protein
MYQTWAGGRFVHVEIDESQKSIAPTVYAKVNKIHSRLADRMVVLASLQ